MGFFHWEEIDQMGENHDKTTMGNSIFTALANLKLTLHVHAVHVLGDENWGGGSKKCSHPYPGRCNETIY